MTAEQMGVNVLAWLDASNAIDKADGCYSAGTLEHGLAVRAAVAELIAADVEYDEARAAINVCRNRESVSLLKRAGHRRYAALRACQGHTP